MLEYRTIMTIWDEAEATRPALDAALGITRMAEGHLDVFAFGIDRLEPGYYFASVSPDMVADSLERARSEATAREASAREVLEREDVPWAIRPVVAPLGALKESAGRLMRFSDLVVLPRPGERDDAELLQLIADGALFVGRARMLLWPETVEWNPDRFGRNVVIAWNESDEALRAVRSALPVLRGAETVQILMIDPPVRGADEAEPGEDLSLYLSRHGVKTEIVLEPKTLPDVADQIFRHAEEVMADMVVMGAFSHSRLREFLLGGVTTGVMKRAPLPVFMAH